MLTMLTIMELYVNPRDLHIFIGEDLHGKFSFLISRGPEHNFKVMLSTTAFATSPEEARGEIRLILQMSQDTMEKEFGSKNVRDHSIQQVLNKKAIKWILEELRAHNEACTWKAPAGFQ